MNEACSFFGAHPVLPVHDLPATVAWYETALGFTREPLWGDPPSHATVHQGGVGIQFSLAPAGFVATTYPGWLYLFVTDADALYTRFQAAGVHILRTPTTYDYGLREFEIQDLNGYRLRFGQYVSND